jgi:hypothetical protein
LWAFYNKDRRLKMIEKVNLKHLLFIGIACMAINVLFLGCSKSSTIDQLQSDADRNLGRVKAESSSVGIEIDRSQTASANAIEAIKRTEFEVRGSREAVGNLNAGIAKLQAILGECEELARKNSNIIERIDGAN